MTGNSLFRATGMALVMTGMAGCGGGGGGGDTTPPPATTHTGVLSDGAIRGVAWTASPSGLSGSTNARGEYSYRDGDTITFTVAGVALAPVPAIARTTPATLAAELFSGANNRNNAALNLAILFQTLDEDGNPDNGILIPDDADLGDTAFAPADDLVLAPATFASTLGGYLPDATVPAPAAALAHFYRTELPGNWRLVNVVHPEEGTTVPGADLDIFLSFDAESRFIWTEYELADSYSALYIGQAAFPEADDTLQVTLAGSDRELFTGRPAGSTDDGNADVFDSAIRFNGDKLVVTVDETGAVATFRRFDNVRGGLTGFWAELDEGTDLGGGTSVTRDDDGALSFGDAVDGLFQIHAGNNRMIAITLDREPEGTNGEYNGIMVVDYSISGTTLTVTDVPLDSVTMPDEDSPPYQAGDSFVLAAATDNDTKRRLQWAGDVSEFLQLARNLSTAERTGAYLQD